MKSVYNVASLLVLVTSLLCVVPGTSDATNPIQKALELLDKMEKETIEESEERRKVYSETSAMCRKRSTELSEEIKLSKSQVEDTKATIDKASDDEAEIKTEIEELSSTLSNAEVDLKAASTMREKEAAEFTGQQKDLVEIIGQMTRSISILEKQQRGDVSFAQLPISVQKHQASLSKQRAAALAEAFSVMIDSSALDSADSERLSSLLQASESDTDGEDAAEESYSTGMQPPENADSIVETLENMMEKAQAQLEAARSHETNSRHNFEKLKLSLEFKISQSEKGMNAAKKALGEAGQTRAEAEGNLEVTKKDLDEDSKALNALHHECLGMASDFENEVKEREMVVKALREAKKTISEMTGAAEKETYGDSGEVSFLQAKSRSSSSSPAARVLRLVRDLGKRQRMPALVEMAHRMEDVVRNGAIARVDPFQKVKKMLSSMINQLVHEMEAEASHKAYCDKETADTQKSKAGKQSGVDRASTRIDTLNSDTLRLRNEVAALQKELLEIMKIQEEIDNIRKEENAIYTKTKPEMEMGLEGIKKALKVLRQYYSQGDEGASDEPEDSKEGVGATIVGLLEVVESDFAKGIVNMDEQEEVSDDAYKKQTADNELAKKIKEQDITFKTQKIKRLSKETAELSTDRDGVQAELDAVNEYYAKIQSACIGRPDAFEERKKRHEAALQGLQDGLQILEGRAALVQEDTRRLRGSTPSQPNNPADQPETSDGDIRNDQDS